MTLRRLDAVVFTGGIGENSVRVRSMTLGRLGPLGLTPDPTANAAMTGGAGGVISMPGPGPVAAVVATNEEWMIACDTAELAQLNKASPGIETPGIETPGIETPGVGNMVEAA